MTREHPPERIQLPTRRQGFVVNAEWEGHPFTISYSLYPDTGLIGEVFADVLHGGQMQATLSDACTLISIALQFGITVPELAKSMAEAPDLLRGKDATVPASPVGAVLDALGAEIAANAEGGA